MADMSALGQESVETTPYADIVCDTLSLLFNTKLDYFLSLKLIRPFNWGTIHYEWRPTGRTVYS